MKLGGYEVQVNTNGMPQKVASAFSRLFGDIVGAEYRFIAYLGSKLVNGTNHALLCQQTLVMGKDIKNIVLIVLNEKPGDERGEAITVVSITPLLSDGGALGGYSIQPTTAIPSDAQAAFDKAFQGFVGSNVKPFALLASKVVKGFEYVFVAETTMLVSPTAMQTSPTKSIALVSVFSDFSGVGFDTIIEGSSSEDSGKLGYAFNWLKDSNWP